MTRSRIPAVLLSSAAVAALALPAAGAAAHRAPADRDHDGMPDTWEHVHHLNVHRNDARADADHDGLANIAEFRAHTDPRDADTDNDGIRDGAEDAGTVVSFSGGVLTLREFSGATLSGAVTDRTEIECDGVDGDSQSRSHDESDDRGDVQGEDRSDDQGENRSDDQGDDDMPTGSTGATGATGPEAACGPESLVPGARVSEAQVAVTSTGHVFRKVELAG